MTPKELAERISNLYPTKNKNEQILFLESLLTEAMLEEKVKLFESEDCCVAALEHDMFMNGKAEAYEEAQKATKCGYCLEAIRALAKGPEPDHYPDEMNELRRKQ